MRQPEGIMFRYCVLAVAIVLLGAGGFAQQSFSFRIVTTGLKAPWEITWGPDDRLWVTERTGKRVIRVNPADGTVTPAVTIDEVYPGTSWHEGLLGMALHPDLLKN